MTEQEHLAVCFMLEYLTDKLALVHCPSKVAVVAMKAFIWISEHGNDSPKELMVTGGAVEQEIERFWAETPSHFGEIGHT